MTSYRQWADLFSVFIAFFAGAEPSTVITSQLLLNYSKVMISFSIAAWLQQEEASWYFLKRWIKFSLTQKLKETRKSILIARQDNFESGSTLSFYHHQCVLIKLVPIGKKWLEICEILCYKSKVSSLYAYHHQIVKRIMRPQLFILNQISALILDSLYTSQNQLFSFF